MSCDTMNKHVRKQPEGKEEVNLSKMFHIKSKAEISEESKPRSHNYLLGLVQPLYFAYFTSILYS